MARADQILDYLRQHKDKFPLDSLKAQLIKQGVPEAEILEAIRRLKSGAETQAAPPPTPPPPPPPPSGRSYILVVDDNKLLLKMITDKLEGAGYLVTCAEDAAQSVVQTEGMKISLIISDIEMPQFGSGIDALKKLRASAHVRKNLPVIFMTGLSPEDAKKRLPDPDPNVRLIHKPVDWTLLRKHIRDLTGLDKPIDAAES